MQQLTLPAKGDNSKGALALQGLTLLQRGQKGCGHAGVNGMSFWPTRERQPLHVRKIPLRNMTSLVTSHSHLQQGMK